MNIMIRYEWIATLVKPEEFPIPLDERLTQGQVEATRTTAAIRAMGLAIHDVLPSVKACWVTVWPERDADPGPFVRRLRWGNDE